ncbi:hypothetical protein [Lentibacillus sediminis]|uniref:hypothetical protein n=1 Tax=Lentibacillus sediminis TaxID=1940529 RepID=UPI000C1C374C|nr:hypothetical protein [Lentibacillus sediminis]
MVNNSEEIWEAWQPFGSLNKYGMNYMVYKEIVRHNDYLKITLEDQNENEIEIVYDDPNQVCPLEYVVWAFRYGTEMGYSLSGSGSKHDLSLLEDETAFRFYKVRNSQYIKEFDQNHLANRHIYPNVEHHVYATGDEILEVIANYEPRFVERRKQ